MISSAGETAAVDCSVDDCSRDAAECLCTTNAQQSSAVDNHSEICSSQSGGRSLECNGEAKEDSCSNETETTDCVNTDCVPVDGNSCTATSANIAEQDSLLLLHWQQKYPGRKIEPHACTTCGKLFLQAVQLRKHMIKHASTDDENGMEFPYTCYVCQRHFLFANDLRRHLISHSNERPYSCVICTRPFKREDDLTKHMKTHGDVRPYQCEECSEQLESSSKLRKHMRKVHGDRFECTHCHVFLSTRSQLSKHKRQRHAGLCTIQVSSELER